MAAGSSSACEVNLNRGARRMTRTRSWKSWLIPAICVVTLPFLLGAQCQNGPWGNLSSERRAAAEANAVSWGGVLYPGKSVTATCSSMDSDHDWYVSCAVVVGEGMPVAVECEYGDGGSCRVALQKVVTKP